MDYKLVHSVQYEDCNVQRSISNEAESMWYKRPVWKGFCGGLAIGILISIVICLVAGTILFKGCHRNINCESSQSLQYQANKSINENEGITIDIKQFSTPATTTFYQRQSTAALKLIHTCQVAGGCNQPPKLKDGMECVFESKDGRTSVRYTLLTKQNVDTVDHCPVSYCQGQNYWSVFNASLSANECYTTGSYGAVYKGKITCTVTGRTCQRWDRDYPQKRNRKHIPSNSDDLHSNYCRDPGPPYDGTPWCYTTDPKVRWEFCHVPLC
ncbi:PLG [Mytilus coruscus]|uniref:PLG n=1 Tax=Mytilus coruscus TaxID=42192 RepID=A0A6J8D150_MYTCO|nr:PLG [Mytilus coruscus]